jgi:hypothetical protein
MSGSDVAVAARAAPGRLAIVAELARSGALRRALRWEPAAAACVLAAALIAWRAGAAPPLVLLRATSLVMVLGIVFILDDRAARLLEAVPFSWRCRFGLRMIVAVGIAAGCFAAMYAVIDPGVTGGLGVAVEAAAVLGVALMATVAALRYWGVDEPGVVAGPVTLAFVGMLVSLPKAWPLIVDRGPDWQPAHLRWSAVLLVTVVSLVGASRDPASRRLRRRRSRSITP